MFTLTSYSVIEYFEIYHVMTHVAQRIVWKSGGQATELRHDLAPGCRGIGFPHSTSHIPHSASHIPPQ
jgi:hypothetical protein